MKCSSLLFLTTSLSVGVLLSLVSNIEAVKRLTRGRETPPRRYLYTNEICKQPFTAVAAIGGSTEFLYFNQYLPFDDNSVFADISIVFNFTFIFGEMKHNVRMIIMLNVTNFA